MIHRASHAALLSALLNFPGVAMAQPAEGYWGPHMMWGGWFHMVLGLLMMLLFFGILLAVVIVGVRWLGSSEHSPFRTAARRGEHSALDILKERLARGEIDVAEYQERRRTLGE